MIRSHWPNALIGTEMAASSLSLDRSTKMCLPGQSVGLKCIDYTTLTLFIVAYDRKALSIR